MATGTAADVVDEGAAAATILTPADLWWDPSVPAAAAAAAAAATPTTLEYSGFSCVGRAMSMWSARIGRCAAVGRAMTEDTGWCRWRWGWPAEEAATTVVARGEGGAAPRGECRKSAGTKMKFRVLK